MLDGVGERAFVVQSASVNSNWARVEFRVAFNTCSQWSVSSGRMIELSGWLN